MDETLTAIGICVAIIFNCWSLWSTKKAQQQNVNIQLFKKRHNVYLLLQNWHDKVNTIFSASTEDRFGKILAFRNEMLSYLEDEKLLSYSSKIRKKENSLSGSDDKTKTVIMSELRRIYREKCSYIAILAKKTKRKIDTATYLFSLDDADVNKIKEFTSTYFNITKEMVFFEDGGDVPTPGKEKELNTDFETLREANNGLNGVASILTKMEEQLDELRGSFSE